MSKTRTAAKSLALAAIVGLLPVTAAALPAQAATAQASAVSVAAEVSIPAAASNPWTASKAPASKFITKVKQATTKANLNLRKSATTSSKSLGVMKKGTKTTPTGKISGKWVQVKWGSKTGWASGPYLTIRTVTSDTSARWMKGFTMIRSGASSSKQGVGSVNFRTKVTRLEVSGIWTHIKTAYYHGWVPTSALASSSPAASYRWSGTDAKTWNSRTGSVSAPLAAGTKYEWRRWDSGMRRDEVKINGVWTWVSGMSTTAPAGVVPADVNTVDRGTFVASASALRSSALSTAPSLLTVPAGTKVTVTHTAGNFSKLSYKGKTGYVLTSALNSRGENSVMAYGTFRTGQGAAGYMAGYTQKALTNLLGTDMYQLWKQDWTFVTSGSRAVVAEQYVYSPASAPAKIKAMDAYEVIMYQGKNMYKRTMMTTKDGSQSWAYRTSPWGESVAKSSGRLIKAADFLKRN